MAMVALHARRSGPAIAAWAAQYPGRPLVVVLTGTDLYRDIAVDASARHSLAVATHLVVLQSAGMEVVPGKGARPCECRRAKAHTNQLDKARIPKRYIKCDFENYVV